MALTKPVIEALLSEKHLFTDIAIALSEVDPATDLVALVVHQLEKITSAGMLVYLSYNEDSQHLVPLLVKSASTAVQKVMNSPEVELLQKGLHVSEETYHKLISQGIGVSETLHGISFGIIPESFEQKVQAAKLFNRYYWLAFALSDKLYGASFFGLKQEQPDPPQELLHFLSLMTAVALRRKIEDAAFKNNTPQKLAEEALRASEEKFRIAFTSSPDAVSITRLTDGKYIEINDGFVKSLGYSSEEVVGRTSSEIGIWDRPEERQRLIRILEKQGFVTNFETVFSGKGGRKLTCQVSARLCKLNGIPHLMAFTRDISDQKKIESEILLAETRFRALIEHAPDGVVLISREGTFKYISPSAKKIFHYGNQDPTYFNPNELTHPNDLPMVLQNLARLIEDPAYIPVLQYRFRASDGTWMWIESTFTNLLNEPGVESIVINFRNITEKKLADLALLQSEARLKKLAEDIQALNLSLEKRVEQRTEELTTSNKELEAFAYTVSHDLRAPVRAIGGFTRILQEDHIGNLNAEGRRLFNIILENTCRMEHLIDDLLSFSRLGRADMTLSTINLAGIVWKCYNELTTPELRSRIKMVLSDLPLVQGDYPMLVQALTNLLSNAIKYTSHRENPEIMIGYDRMGNELVFFVKDNGIGFNMKYADKLFGVFQRLHSVKDYEGTGVGLAIVQRIIFRHGGRIWANAEMGKGATFYFTLISSQTK